MGQPIDDRFYRYFSQSQRHSNFWETGKQYFMSFPCLWQNKEHRNYYEIVLWKSLPLFKNISSMLRMEKGIIWMLNQHFEILQSVFVWAFSHFSFHSYDWYVLDANRSRQMRESKWSPSTWFSSRFNDCRGGPKNSARCEREEENIGSKIGSHTFFCHQTGTFSDIWNQSRKRGYQYSFAPHLKKCIFSCKSHHLKIKHKIEYFHFTNLGF